MSLQNFYVNNKLTIGKIITHFALPSAGLSLIFLTCLFLTTGIVAPKGVK